MQVEIYDERELNITGCEPEPEALAIIEELGLKRQLTESGERMPYPKPTQEQIFVMKILFGQCTEIKNYDAGVIPYRILKEIKSYIGENPNHGLYIYHAPIAIDDPILISIPDKNYSWYAREQPEQWRLIARWGDALLPWDELYNKAVARYKGMMAEKIEELKIELETYRNRVLPMGRLPSIS